MVDSQSKKLQIIVIPSRQKNLLFPFMFKTIRFYSSGGVVGRTVGPRQEILCSNPSRGTEIIFISRGNVPKLCP